MTLTTKACCTILVTSNSARERLGEIATQYTADGISPLEYRCPRCGLNWDANPLTDFREVTCSNCYNERIVLTMVRLDFENWGEQNGGETEQRGRYDRAVREFAPALAAIEKAAVRA